MSNTSDKKSTNFRKLAEEFINKGSDTAFKISPDDFNSVLHELRVHKIELELQNEELRRSQLELAEMRDKYVDLYDFAPIGCITLDKNNVITEANLTICTMLEVERIFLLNNYFRLFISPDSTNTFYELRSKLLISKSTLTKEVKLLKKGGDELYTSMECAPLLNSEGKFNGIRIAVIDITERRKAEKELAGTNKKLEETKRLSDIGTLAATVAHELRNPLGVIQTAVYNVKRKTEKLFPDLDKHLKNIEKKIDQSEQIIKNLLSYSRIVAPHFQPIFIIHVLEECIEERMEKFSELDVKIIKQYNSILHDVQIEADPVQISELLCNILNNAYQSFSESFGIIEIDCQYNKTKNNFKVLCRDNGVGIEQDLLKNIYEPFFTKNSKGIGLGMTVCSEVVRRHGGSIEILSKIKEGTEITVTLPILQE